MTQEEAYDLLTDHNCAGLCSCDECKEAKKVLDEERQKQESEITR